ncbi:putative amine oxidase [Mycobacterium xenopi 3993]|nr:putative amine oxidase [Mycobacterium xenopi 3993]
MPTVRRARCHHSGIRDVDVDHRRKQRSRIWRRAWHAGLFACWQSLRPSYLRMLAEIVRFHRAAKRLLRNGADDDLETLGSFLDRHGFSAFFVDHFITPLVAGVWSCGGGDALRYPARYLFVFLANHGMLSVFGSPTWRTVSGARQPT